MIEGGDGGSRYSHSVEAVARKGRASLPAKVGIPQQDNKLLWCFFFSVFLDSEGSRYQVGNILALGGQYVATYWPILIYQPVHLILL